MRHFPNIQPMAVFLGLDQKRDADKSKYLRDNLNETYIKDVVERHRIQGDVVMDTR